MRLNALNRVRQPWQRSKAVFTKFQWVGGLLAATVLAAVFLMYTQPDFMVQMANQLWACF